MSRNSTGTYSLPITGNPVVSGTTVSSTWANATLSDVATEITNSLDRSGRGAMLAPLQLQDGSSSAPALTFSSESTSGLYRAGTGDVRWVTGGTEVAKGKTDGTFTMNTPVVGTNHLLLNGGNPGSTTAYKNYLTPKNAAKAWAFVQASGGVLTILDGFNIASASMNTVNITLTFGQAFSSANYAAVIAESSTSYMVTVAGVLKVAASCGFNIVNTPAWTIRDPSANQVIFSVVFYGAQ